MPFLSFRTRSGWMDSTQLIKDWPGHWLLINSDLPLMLLKKVQEQKTQNFPTKIMMERFRIWTVEIHDRYFQTILVLNNCQITIHKRSCSILLWFFCLYDGIFELLVSETAVLILIRLLHPSWHLQPVVNPQPSPSALLAERKCQNWRCPIFKKNYCFAGWAK